MNNQKDDLLDLIRTAFYILWNLFSLGLLKALISNMDASKNNALKFVILLGIVSLFADITYEGAWSINGQYLAILGASGTVVGITAGFGELIGHCLRLLSGYLTDKTKQYWTITLIGYSVNLIAVPLLALAGHWEIAAVFIVLERAGKAIRTPARDLMLSYATSKIGQGFGFGLHEALDQIGAILGPLIVAFILYLKGSYQNCFALLLLPALIALSVLVVARLNYSNPQSFETEKVKLKNKGFSKTFWFYIIAVALVACGYADFALIAYHFKKVSIVSENWIPIFYSLAMGVDAISALVFGRLFDKIGVFTFVIVTLLSLLFAPCIFMGNFHLALIGMILWGIGIGTQESIMRAAISGMVQIDNRGLAYGIFNTIYGLFWFLGSALMGFLYDFSIFYLILFSVIVQVISIPVFVLSARIK